ncbi:MAG: phosphate propanoyltransferase [Clostridiales Family XIII bacterium]|jgi:propanediol utilization protein|nr:phosphate propanoyltransferase [Clostridiales Family XIII bacterium]
MNLSQIEAVVARALEELAGGAPTFPIPVEVSARHAHLSEAAFRKLFGQKAALIPRRVLSQPGEFLAEQRVKLAGPKGEISDVAVLGPLRPHTQIELSKTDCRHLGIEAPLRLSGDVSGAADLLVVGGHGCFEATGSAIIPKAHLHLRPQDAAAMEITDGMTVSVAVGGERPTVFKGVVARVSEDFSLALHIDTDEAGACMAAAGSLAYVVAAGSRAEPLAPPARPSRDERRLITESAAIAMVAERGQGEIFLPRAAIVTPSALDVFRAARRQVTRY